jgi:dTDP-4-dehydrorhamnose 3,5-epimerase-like enzyme
MDLSDVRIIELPRHNDVRGNLSFFEGENQIPFAIKRTYWIYDVPGGCVRGGHAYNIQKEVIIALSGSFDVIVDDGKSQKTYQLNRSYYGLYIPSRIWRELSNFSTNSLALIVSSTDYDSVDYIRDYDVFLNRAINEK